jgi:putative iron-dependent peroxidase
LSSPQPGILAPVPAHSRYLEFALRPGRNPQSVLRALSQTPTAQDTVVGLSASLMHGLAAGAVTGLRPFPALRGTGYDVPSTQASLWLWIYGEERGQLMHRARALTTLLENPTGADAHNVAIVTGDGAITDDSSFVAVQQWVHDLQHFEGFEQDERDNMIGRRLSDNEELADAPQSAHVKRTAQESFDPEAFVVRRSSPWSDASGEGLMFVAFGASLDAFEAQMRRMVGEEDGIVDALFRFSRPVTGSYFWCPPVREGCVVIPGLGLAG